MERLQSEVTRYKNLQLKSAKDCEKYKEERDSVFNEYRLIMSERDQVIKEVDKLQTELESAEARLKNTSSERVVASEELEALRQVPAALAGTWPQPTCFMIRFNLQNRLQKRLLTCSTRCLISHEGVMSL